MFTAATGLAILHVLDDAFIGKQPERLPVTTCWRRVIGFFGRRLLGSS